MSHIVALLAQCKGCLGHGSQCSYSPLMGIGEILVKISNKYKKQRMSDYTLTLNAAHSIVRVNSEGSSSSKNDFL